MSVIRENEEAWESVQLSSTELKQADAVVIMTDHNVIDYQFIVDHTSLVVDTRNATAKTVHTLARVVSLSGPIERPRIVK